MQTYYLIFCTDSKWEWFGNNFYVILNLWNNLVFFKTFENAYIILNLYTCSEYGKFLNRERCVNLTKMV